MTPTTDVSTHGTLHGTLRLVSPTTSPGDHQPWPSRGWQSTRLSALLWLSPTFPVKLHTDPGGIHCRPGILRNPPPGSACSGRWLTVSTDIHRGRPSRRSMVQGVRGCVRNCTVSEPPQPIIKCSTHMNQGRRPWESAFLSALEPGGRRWPPRPHTTACKPTRILPTGGCCAGIDL